MVLMRHKAWTRVFDAIKRSFGAHFGVTRFQEKSNSQYPCRRKKKSPRGRRVVLVIYRSLKKSAHPFSAFLGRKIKKTLGRVKIQDSADGLNEEKAWTRVIRAIKRSVGAHFGVTPFQVKSNCQCPCRRNKRVHVEEGSCWSFTGVLKKVRTHFLRF